MFFIIISTLPVSGGVSAHHQELIKLYVQPWVLPCFPAVYRWCGWVPTHPHQRSIAGNHSLNAMLLGDYTMAYIKTTAVRTKALLLS
jgi:hypothetical protein